jgi:phospholipid/cholesterol/gamma-HCH transport system ATP-binding protein
VPTDPIIHVERLTAGYDDLILLENVSFDVHPGEVFVILGGSGCGKSTLLKHMIGLYEPKSGDVILDGESIVKAEGDERRDILKKIGVMYQSGALFGSMTLLENVRLPLEEYTDLDQRALDIICRLERKVVAHDLF